MQKIQIHMKSFHANLLKRALVFIEKELSPLYCNLQTHTAKRYKQKYTVIKSPHVHKKSREQFQLEEFHHVLSIESPKVLPLLFLLKSGNFYGVQIKASIKYSSYYKKLR